MTSYGAGLLGGVRRAFREHVASPPVDRWLFRGALAAILITAASFLGRAVWVFELLTHFRFQAAIGSLVLLLIA
ncbi:MAG TPA: hypothetical protein VE175_12255, partial [Woeseiaceae bacterium]|nr:hypothetical protein [Woeseiaceae bacterium]